MARDTNEESAFTHEIAPDFCLIQYPSSPDTRGSARITYKRKHYYFGRHGSAYSYLLFGLWKARVDKTRELQKSTDLRPLVESILSQEPPSPPARHPWLALSLFTSAVTLCISLVAATWIVVGANPKVDNVALSNQELSAIRGIRKTQGSFDRRLATTDLQSRFERIMKLKDEGPINARNAHDHPHGVDDM